MSAASPRPAATRRDLVDEDAGAIDRDAHGAARARLRGVEIVEPETRPPDRRPQVAQDPKDRQAGNDGEQRPVHRPEVARRRADRDHDGGIERPEHPDADQAGDDDRDDRQPGHPPSQAPTSFGCVGGGRACREDGPDADECHEPAPRQRFKRRLVAPAPRGDIEGRDRQGTDDRQPGDRRSSSASQSSDAQASRSEQRRHEIVEGRGSGAPPRQDDDDCDRRHGQGRQGRQRHDRPRSHGVGRAPDTHPSCMARTASSVRENTP